MRGTPKPSPIASWGKGGEEPAPTTPGEQHQTSGRLKQVSLTNWFKSEQKHSQLAATAQPTQTNQQTPDVSQSKDSQATPSSEECKYIRGVCSRHKMKGEKYYVVQTRWMDRGGGKGYGNVYRRLVRYRCKWSGQTPRILQQP